MDEEFVKALKDYFTPEALIELLEIDIDEIIFNFRDEILEQEAELKEYINYE